MSSFADALLAGGTVSLLLAACLGSGALVLAGLRLWPTLGACDRAGFAFAIGFGVLGWAVMPLGLAGGFHPAAIAALAALGLPGLWLFRQPVCGDRWTRPEIAVALVLAGTALLTVLVALAPPTDADTVAYHFDLPRRFTEAGQLFFVPRAIEGAVPLLVQMTYTAARVLGGEPAMLLWAGTSSVAVMLCVVLTARAFLPRLWALALGALLLTTPAVVYGAPSGQVEFRAVLFTLFAALAAARAVRGGDWRWALLAGMLAGFYGASKLFGLLFMAAIGLSVLAQPRWFRAGLACGAAMLFAAGPWYAWTFINTGDPFFPVLWSVLGAKDGLWNAETELAFRTYTVAPERAVPSNLFWLLAYPFKATLDGFAAFESSRTGFGPVVWLLLPFALAGAAWRGLRHPLVMLALVVTVSYSLWFFLSESQRLRHLLPLYPLLLLLAAAAAERATRLSPALRWPVAGALAASLCIQLAGQALFSRGLLPPVLGLESRAAFIARMVYLWPGVDWANRTLTPEQKLLTVTRIHLYYLNVPYYFCTHSTQALVDCRYDATDERRFHAQAQAQGVTHLLVDAVDDPTQPGAAGTVRRLVLAGCARELQRIDSVWQFSRTLAFRGGLPTRHVLAELAPGCPPSAGAAASFDVALPEPGR